MRLLFTLLLTCIILEKFNNGINFEKLYIFKSKKNSLITNPNILKSHVIYKWYEKCFVYIICLCFIEHFIIIYYLSITLLH